MRWQGVRRPPATQDVRGAQHPAPGRVPSLRGQARLTEESVEAALREIRLALLEADVNFRVVKAFVDRVRDRAVDQEVLRSLTPDAARRAHRARRDAGAVRRHDRRAAAGGLVAAGGDAAGAPGLRQDDDGGEARRVAGPSGAPRAARVDRRAAAGGHRAAVRGGAAGRRCGCTTPTGEMDPVARAAGALTATTNLGFDTLIVDTAGRLHIDDELMAELEAIKRAVAAGDRLFVADAMTGQDAIKSAGEFNRRIGVTGVVLTKTGWRRAGRRGAVGRLGARACRSRSSAAASACRTSSRSTPTAWCRGCSAWATCCRSSRRPSRPSRPRTRRGSSRRSGATSSRSRTSAISCGRSGRWARSSRSWA